MEQTRSFIKPTQNKTFSIYDPLEIKLLNRLRVDLSQLNSHKLRHNFSDISNPLCSYSLENKTTAHFFLDCRNYNGSIDPSLNRFNQSLI